MDNSNFLKIQYPNSFVSKKFEVGASSSPMNSRQSGGKFAGTAIRMRALRRASQWPERADFAKNIGITQSALSNFENGFPLSNGLIDMVVRKLPWISSDWLRYQREEALSAAIVQRLEPLLVEESDTTTPRSRSKGGSKRDKPGR